MWSHLLHEKITEWHDQQTNNNNNKDLFFWEGGGRSGRLAHNALFVLSTPKE